jgi:tetratricopeptide (TPR) repeat protein
MWSQAVIAEVYTLNALFLISTLYCFQRWVMDPEKPGWMYASVFVFALGLTNHHTLLFILPAFLLAVWLLRLWFFGTFLCGIFLLAGSTLGVLAWYSNDPQMHQIALRMGTLVLALVALTGFWYLPRWDGRKFLRGALFAGCAIALIHLAFGLKPWGLPFCLLGLLAGGLVASSLLDQRSILVLVTLGWIGLLPYAYMPWASSTNPPMNWGYARERAGFFEAINRGQYSDSLTLVIKKAVGGLLGVEVTIPGDSNNPSPELAAGLISSVKAYYQSLEENMSLPICLLALLSLLFWGHLEKRFQRWLIFLGVSFVLMAFLLTTITPPAGYDKQALWSGQVFYLQSHCIFALGVAYGLLAGLLWLEDRFPELPTWTGATLIFLSLIPLQLNFQDSNLRNHWFGWQYGTDLLRNLPKDAVVFGGTDAGRFVPTYTIFCESRMNPFWKRDPSFDRSDLYIITQNALANSNYLRYIRDHYDAESRPKTFSRFERWLGRDVVYPKDPLLLPTDEQLEGAFFEYAQERKKQRDGSGIFAVSGIQEVFVINGMIARRIFEKNKDKHTFYVEESYPIPWMYDYMEPSGLLLKMNPEPVRQLDPKIIAQDRTFWDAYEARLLSTPGFENDFPAQRAFAKLRHSIANLYNHRHLWVEAEYAYRQALRLLPIHQESLLQLCELYKSQGHLDQSIQMLRGALVLDPKNEMIQSWLDSSVQFLEMDKQIAELLDKVAKDPKNLADRREMIGLMIQRQKWDEVFPQMIEAAAQPDLAVEDLITWVNAAVSQGRLDPAVAMMRVRVEQKPDDSNTRYNLASTLIIQNKTEEALKQLARARKTTPDRIKTIALQDSRWKPMWNDKRFQVIMK